MYPNPDKPSHNNSHTLAQDTAQRIKRAQLRQMKISMTTNLALQTSLAHSTAEAVASDTAVSTQEIQQQQDSYSVFHSPSSFDWLRPPGGTMPPKQIDSVFLPTSQGALSMEPAALNITVNTQEAHPNDTASSSSQKKLVTTSGQQDSILIESSSDESLDRSTSISTDATKAAVPSSTNNKRKRKREDVDEMGRQNIPEFSSILLLDNAAIANLTLTAITSIAKAIHLTKTQIDALKDYRKKCINRTSSNRSKFKFYQDLSQNPIKIINLTTIVADLKAQFIALGGDTSDLATYNHNTDTSKPSSSASHHTTSKPARSKRATPSGKLKELFKKLDFKNEDSLAIRGNNEASKLRYKCVKKGLSLAETNLIIAHRTKILSRMTAADHNDKQRARLTTQEDQIQKLQDTERSLREKIHLLQQSASDSVNPHSSTASNISMSEQQIPLPSSKKPSILVSSLHQSPIAEVTYEPQKVLSTIPTPPAKTRSGRINTAGKVAQPPKGERRKKPIIPENVRNILRYLELPVDDDSQLAQMEHAVLKKRLERIKPKLSSEQIEAVMTQRTKIINRHHAMNSFKKQKQLLQDNETEMQSLRTDVTTLKARLTLFQPPSTTTPLDLPSQLDSSHYPEQERSSGPRGPING
jgi:cell division protein FtsB